MGSWAFPISGADLKTNGVAVCSIFFSLDDKGRSKPLA